ncbi:threonine/serine exporter ThrE family protein [Actinotalea sp. C106]|uniref:threonine/serine ThrE exporter family protein n=1 Tax=Actinotalea sp. C106 TaxID=2908644 RepID=UPI002028FAB7|nr:threonine/serine exporter family protein [Actinotalea sp. C106]
MRRRWEVRQLARRAMGGSQGIQVGARAYDAGIDDIVARGALELGLRIGEAMLSLGAAAADVTAAIQRVVRTFGLDGCQVELTFTAITVSYDRGVLVAPVTVMRLVRDRVVDYGRLAGVIAVADEVAGDDLSGEDAVDRLEWAHGELDSVIAAPRSYRRWVVTVALAALAGSVALLLGGGVGVALVAGATTATIDRVTWALSRWGLPPFYVQIVGAGLVTTVAITLLIVVPHLPVEIEVLPPALVVASGIVVLLAGLSLVGAAEDALSGFPLTAAARSFEVVVLTLGIVVGIGGVLDIARRAGVQLEVIQVPPTTTPLLLQGFAAAVVALSWAIASYARPRAVLVAGAAGAIAWIVSTLLLGSGIGPAVAGAVAALAVGFLSETFAPRFGVPSIVASVCGIVPLLPGLAVYRGMFQIVNDPQAGLIIGATVLLGAAMIGLGLAAGVTLGEFLASPLRLGTRNRRAPTEQ